MIERTPVIPTDAEKIYITNSNIVSRSDLLCQEMDIRVGQGRRRRGRTVDDTELRQEIRTLRARLETLETSRHTKDISEEDILDEDEETTAKASEVRLLKSIFGAGSSSKADMPFYSGSLDLE